jgi:phosphoribosylanthranilate isomerase
MRRVRVKICGVTRAEDAAAAALADADAIGMIFYPPAPRNISLDRARAVLSVLPPFVTPVGVFVDAQADEILDTAAQLGLRTVQLNGEQSPEDVAELEGLSVIKAVRVSPETLSHELSRWRKAPPNLVGLVMEPAGTGQAGGSGVANDWSAIRAAIDAGEFKELPPLIAAGGLTPESVGQVVRLIRPFAVDVSSGVEESLGIKSHQKIEQFIQAVHGAE